MMKYISRVTVTALIFLLAKLFSIHQSSFGILKCFYYAEIAYFMNGRIVDNDSLK